MSYKFKKNYRSRKKKHFNLSQSIEKKFKTSQSIKSTQSYIDQQNQSSQLCLNSKIEISKNFEIKRSIETTQSYIDQQNKSSQS